MPQNPPPGDFTPSGGDGVNPDQAMTSWQVPGETVRSMKKVLRVAGQGVIIAAITLALDFTLMNVMFPGLKREARDA
jgi:hypothetical protein